MGETVQPDPGVPGAFRVLVDGSSQAWVDPTDPLRLEFEYVQRITEVLDVTLLSRPA
ncbi:MAG TPA: spermidine synthase, partial [Propionibacteriaceae bacterium]|nr:spermidine synthase [Propionibacteriaceae bacterium]HBY23012.1 spermidine synthase [Propionibacteriaceae bacterium]